jgi:hypothetical protein
LFDFLKNLKDEIIDFIQLLNGKLLIDALIIFNDLRALNYINLLILNICSKTDTV